MIYTQLIEVLLAFSIALNIAQFYVLGEYKKYNNNWFNQFCNEQKRSTLIEGKYKQIWDDYDKLISQYRKAVYLLKRRKEEEK